MAEEGQRAEEMIELQTTVRALEVEVIGRYVSRPDLIDDIRRVLANSFDQLGQLYAAQRAGFGCPRGYIHESDCTCMPYAAATRGDAEMLEQRRRLIAGDAGDDV